MDTAVRALVGLGLLWAAGALVYEVRAAGRGRPRDFSRRSGNPWRGVLYVFTTAMLPGRKESARRHPAEFAVGMTLHAGAILTLLSLPLLLLLPPEAGTRWLLLLRPLLALSFLAGLVLLARRLLSRNLRSMSAPDDYLAVLATCGLLAAAFFSPSSAAGPFPLLASAVPFLLYLPLGKLRHMVFFFAARADYGWRLGYRGVCPPPHTREETGDAGSR